MKTKIAIQFGIASGWHQAKRLRQAITDAGYTVVRNPAEADVIVGHSAGCFWLPAAPTHQRLLLIDPPYWPGKTVGERGRQRLRSNLRYRQHNYPFGYWLGHNAWSVFYSIRDYKHTRAIVKHAPQYDLAKVIRNHRAIVVRNSEDDWLTADLAPLRKANPTLRTVELPGDHAHCLFHPQPYVNLIGELLQEQ